MLRLLIRARVVAAIVATVTFVAACGSDMTRPSGPPGLHIVAGADQSDTAAATLPHPLVVEVRDATGAPAAQGTLVQFTAIAGDSSPFTLLTLAVRDSGPFASVVTEPVDSRGQASVIVRLGQTAGSDRVVISVAQRGLADTAKFTTAAASLQFLTVSPTDTIVVVGQSVPFHATGVDAFDNLVATSVSWSVSGASASVTSSGVVTVAGIGIDTVTVTGPSGSKRATAFVRAAPRFRIAGWRSGDDDVVLSDMGGGNLRILTKVTDGGVGVHPKWLPGDTTIVFAALANGVETLEIADTNGVVRPVFSKSDPNVTDRVDPAPTADGQWLFFGARDVRCATPSGPPMYCLHRSHLDGTGEELLGTSELAGTNLAPSPSPDGLRVAVATGSPSLQTANLRVFDVTAGVPAAWSIPGYAPAWSPDGTTIAFYGTVAGEVQRIDPDGTGQRTLSSSLLGTPVEWTRDSRYLATEFVFSLFGDAGIYSLFDAKAGASIPLPVGAAFRALSFKPGSGSGLSP